MQPPQRSKWARRWDRLWTGLKIYLVIVGLFTFPLWICNEGTRVAVWSTWQNKDDMPTLLEGLEVIEDINAFEHTVNASIGWTQPLSYWAYKGWISAIDYWIQATQTRILSTDPALMEGRKIRLRFDPKYIRNLEDRTILENGNIEIELPQPPEEDHCIIEGRVHVTPEGKIQIKGRTIPNARRPREKKNHDPPPPILADPV